MFRCILVDSGKKYTLNDFESVLETDLFFNVERGGVRGSYRHLPINIKTNLNVQTAHAKLSVLTKGDLTSLQWIESPKYTLYLYFNILSLFVCLFQLCN